MTKHILVTGGNAGIGLAMCKLLVTGSQPESEYATPKPPPCHVYLGSRDLERGAAALKSITDAFPDAAGKIEVVQIDVTDDASCTAAAATLKAKGVTLYALVNNAGLGLAQNEASSADTNKILNTNLYGPKRVTEAMVGLVDPNEGRIVHVSSGAASMWLKKQSAELKKTLSNPDITMDELESTMKAQIAADNAGFGNGYGMSKAGLNGLTLIQAKAYPNLKVVALSPGFIDTNMTKGFNAKLSPEQGCVSALCCLFGSVTSGYYYGSDGLRGPFTMTRDPGMPAYEGEENPDEKKYNK
jgi:NAD(P)-dependent dehydrogenase (short-subunit alcohol dehydrogenase family)